MDDNGNIGIAYGGDARAHGWAVYASTEANFDKLHPNLAEFMLQAVQLYVNSRETSGSADI